MNENLAVEEIIPKLAALMYYSSPRSGDEEGKKSRSYEKLDPEKQKPFLSLAEAVMVHLDRLNLTVIPKAKIKNQEEIEALLRSKIETTVKDFFAGIKFFRRELIPEQELVARIYQIWAAL